jgi:hypothetical protein
MFTCDAPTDKPSGDPTGTMDIRRKFLELAGIRFRKARALIQKAVVDQDMLGLKAGSTSAIAMAGAPGNKDLYFRQWLSEVLTKTVIGSDGSWMRPLLQLSYNRAIKRAMRLSKTNALPTDMVETMDALLALCNVELRGICDAVTQRCARAASLAWLHNDKPAVAFKDMGVAVNVVGIARTSAMSSLMVVKTFNTATLDQFEAAGIKQVGLIPETVPQKRDGRTIKDAKKSFGFKGAGSRSSREQTPSSSTIGRIKKQEKNFEGLSEVNIETAGDEDVCPICQDLEDSNPYDIDEARSLLPAHPFCRCAFVPLD